MADPHLNAFVPYGRDAWHEDQLTRAAMVVARLVPEALEALVQRVGGVSLSELPTGSIDIQTQRVTAEPDAPVEELVSVFLSPNRREPEAIAELPKNDERSQRLDAVLRFEPRLVIVIESKVVEGVDDWQARLINLGGTKPRRMVRHDFGWHELIEDWWQVAADHQLSSTPKALLDDFFEFVDSEFPNVGPFSTLRRARDNPVRVRRRLEDLISEASGLEVEGREAIAFFPEDRVHALQRVQLKVEDDELVLHFWPAELIGQARWLYGEPEQVERLIALIAQDRWAADPNPHGSFYNAPWYHRWYMTCDLDPERYLRQWIEDLGEAGRRKREDFEGLWPWLLQRGYAAEDDRAEFDALLARGRKQYDLRPSVAVRRTWPRADARALDDEPGRLAGEIRQAIDELLSALDEPTLEQLAESTLSQPG